MSNSQPFDFKSGLHYQEKFRVEWDRTSQGKVWIRSHSEIPDTRQNLIVVRSDDVERFIEAVREAAKGAPKCEHCRGTGERQA